MTSTNDDGVVEDSPSSSPKPSSSSHLRSLSNRDRDSKAKEKSRRAGDQPETTPGAVASSNRLERAKEASSGEKKRSSGKSSSFSSKPGAVASTGRDRRKGDSSSSGKPGAVASTGRDRRKRGSGSSGKPGAVPSTGRDRRKGGSGSSGKPGAVPSTGRDRRKGGSGSSGKPGAVPSTGRDRPKGSSGSSKPGAVPSTGRDRPKGRRSKASSSGSSKPRPVSDEKLVNLAAVASNQGPIEVASSEKDVKTGLVAETVDDSQMQTTTDALRAKNREVEALRQELQRTRDEQTSQSRRGASFWGKVCLVSTILIGGIFGAVVYFTRDNGSAEATTTPAIPNPSDSTIEPTVNPDGQSVFDPPSLDTCSKISEGLSVDGQQIMTEQSMIITMNVNLRVDISKDQWVTGMLQNIQAFVMPSVVGCGDTTLDLYSIGNAQINQNNATVLECQDQSNGPCYTVEVPVNIFIKEDVERYYAKDLNQLVKEVFQSRASLVANGEDESSRAIKDIGFLTAVADTASPSQAPSKELVGTGSPTNTPSFEPTTMMPSDSPTSLPSAVPTVAPVIGPTLVPSLAPSLDPSLSPTSGPTLAPAPEPTTPPTPLPTPGPSASPSLFPSAIPSMSPSQAPSASPTTMQPSETPSAAPTSERMGLEATLSRFAPFDGCRKTALDWLKVDTWEPPTNAADEKTLWVERFVLAVFYCATNGNGWTNTNDGWMTSDDVCSWTGIQECNSDGSITKWIFDRRSMVGDFPDEMRELSNLEYIQFGYNDGLSGTIPSFLLALTKLTLLAIGATGRTGTLPSELWKLTKLKNFRVWGNYLTGTIPSGFSALTDLDTFHVTHNDLTGTLPDEFPGLSQFTQLRVEENLLTGTVPPLPSLSKCTLASEGYWSAIKSSSKAEGNCFTDTTNAPGKCNLSGNCISA